MRDRAGAWLVSAHAAIVGGCTPSPSVAPQVVSESAATPPDASEPPPPRSEPLPARPSERAPAATIATPACTPADWSEAALSPLLAPGKTSKPGLEGRSGAAEVLFRDECTDAPNGPRPGTGGAAVLDGVEIRLASATPAGKTGRGWHGNRCTFEIRLADGTGPVTKLGAAEIPPFNTINAVVRRGAQAWLSVGFNGYAAEFPGGGNRVLALDLCRGAVVWQSANATSNGGLLLLDGYLIAPYGFTRERRYVYVFNAGSGAVIQKLPVLENVCPSKSWAPNWRKGERCDAPGQLVGAANSPRVEEGLFVVDTNTGSSTFEVL